MVDQEIATQAEPASLWGRLCAMAQPYLQLVRFASVGATGAIVKLGTMYLFTDTIGIHYMISYLLSSILAITSNFILNTIWTFKTRFSLWGKVAGWLKYLAVSSIAIAINEVILFILTGYLGVWYMFSAAFGILTAFAINYLLSKRVVWGSSGGQS